MKSFALWFFQSKNKFVLLVFLAYIITVLVFSGGYYWLIAVDAQKRSHTIPHFVINPDISSEKLRQNKFDLLTTIEADSLVLHTTSNQLDFSYKQLPHALLAKVTTNRNNHFYANAWMINQIRLNVNVDQWESYAKIVIPTSTNSTDIITRRPLGDSITWEHRLLIDWRGSVMSQMYVTVGLNKILLSSIQLNQDQESLDRRLRPRQTNYLAQWIFRKYQRGITHQMKTIVNEETILPDPHLLEFEQISVQRKQLVNALASNKQILMGIKNPDWAFVDILFFTVVSLFANNYSDIYPNSTLARMLIMSEFVVVWFLTICAISLEPDGFFKKKR